jgi:hypothetical protein
MDAKTAAAVRSMAAKHDIPAAHLAAVVDVESGGHVFAEVAGELRPLILFEPHVFFKRLREPERGKAVAAGLAYPKWGTRPYPKTQAERWAQIDRAALIDDDAAYESASYGVGQVMGYHWKALGYPSLQAFLDEMFAGVEGQIEAMLRYCTVNKLVDEIRDGRWLAFARGYNGSGQARRYGRLLAAAAKRYGGGIAAPDGMLRLGSRGARVRELQALLTRAGFPVKVDGDFGPATRTAVMAFQKSKRIKVDGVYGPQTEAALSSYRVAPEERPGAEAATEIDEVKQGAGGVAGGVAIEVLQNKVDEATGALQMVDGFQPWLGYGLAALSVVAFGLAAWGVWRGVSGWLKSRKTTEA